jgi:ADP-heptose:LPS heptosyltransferase
VRILAIRLARFGDLVLLLPAMTLLKARLPASHLTLLTDQRWAPLATMCPAIDEVVTIDRIGMRDSPYWRAIPAIWRLMADLRRRAFDAAIDFHGFRETNLLTWWTGARQKFGLKRFDQSYFNFCFNLPPVLEDKSLHVSEVFLSMVRRFAPAPVDIALTPSLVIPKDAETWATENLPATPFVVLYVDAPVKERIWPLSRFVILADRIVANLRASVVVVAGPGRELPNFSAGVQVFSDLSISRLSAAIAAARLLVSNDTGPMHLGPALGTPTVGIFSVGVPTHFRPTGTLDRYVQGNPIDRIGVDEVMGTVNQVWAASDR